MEVQEHGICSCFSLVFWGAEANQKKRMKSGAQLQGCQELSLLCVTALLLPTKSKHVSTLVRSRWANICRYTSIPRQISLVEEQSWIQLHSWIRLEDCIYCQFLCLHEIEWSSQHIIYQLSWACCPIDLECIKLLIYSRICFLLNPNNLFSLSHQDKTLAD